MIVTFQIFRNKRNISIKVISNMFLTSLPGKINNEK